VPRTSLGYDLAEVEGDCQGERRQGSAREGVRCAGYQREDRVHSRIMRRRT